MAFEIPNDGPGSHHAAVASILPVNVVWNWKYTVGYMYLKNIQSLSKRLPVDHFTNVLKRTRIVKDTVIPKKKSQMSPFSFGITTGVG